MAVDLPVLIIGFLVVSFIVTLLFKKLTKFDTYYLITLIKTKKPLKFFERMGRYHKFLDAFATIGLILGFGAFAVDFLYGRKLYKQERIMLFIGTTVVLSGFLILIDDVFGNIFSNNLLVGNLFPLMVLSFGLMGLAGFTLFSLFMQALDIISKYLIGSRSCPGVAPLIPGVEIPGVPIVVPLHGWISLLIILVVHESMHGILGKRHGFSLKSAGVILFGFLPLGAFVEPDEEQMKKEPDEKVLPFLAAGPMANIVTMILAGLVFFAAASSIGPLTEQLYPGLQDNLFDGVVVAGVLEETSFCGGVYPSSAFGNLMEGDLIKEINGTEIKNPQTLYSTLRQNRFEEKTFLVERENELVSMTLLPNAMGQFGFQPEAVINEDVVIPESYADYGFVVSLFVEFMFWLFLLNFLVAAINFLPMHPFDGGRIAKIIFAPYLSFSNKTKKQKQELVGKIFLYVILALFLINALPLFF